MECLPAWLREECKRLDAQNALDIRLRAGRPVCLRFLNGLEKCGSRAVEREEIERCAQALTGHTLRARGGQTGKGFIALEGGHRLGLCGRMTEENGALVMRELGSLCLRLAREKKGIAAPIYPYCRAGALIIGAPGSGKTTLLRDLIRLISLSGRAVSVSDERGELAACLRGEPTLDIGNADVLDECPKYRAIEILSRAMSPEFIACDELGGQKDFRAALSACDRGICLLATAHAGSAEDFLSRPLARELSRRVKRLLLLKKPGAPCLNMKWEAGGWRQSC